MCFHILLFFDSNRFIEYYSVKSINSRIKFFKSLIYKYLNVNVIIKNKNKIVPLNKCHSQKIFINKGSNNMKLFLR
ncbi:MAG: hypothetical protein C0593_00970 [Marinilabiliales bacterium]|nr:MAG: hypothetical protein C0593_00970 [Marinilabiliales bacterium]